MQTRENRLGIGVGVFVTAVSFCLLLFTLSPLMLTAYAAPTVDPSVSFTAGSYSVVEPDSSNTTLATLDVEMSNLTATQTVVVEYRTFDTGEADPGSDYQTKSGFLTFVGSETKSITITIVGDDDYEGNERFSVDLSSVQANFNVNFGTNRTATVLINDNDPQPTSTPLPTSGATPVYVDRYEPNNSLSQAYGTSADASALCDNTVWPIGDEDYFSFYGRGHTAYLVKTTNLDAGVDTVLDVYDVQGNRFDTNDNVDGDNTQRRSEIIFVAPVDGFYYARVTGNDPTDQVDRTYCFEVDITTAPPTSTPPPNNPGADSCEYNGTFDDACLITPSETALNMNFVPYFGYGINEVDNDYYRLWVNQGLEYTCETTIPSVAGINDTNMIFYNHDRVGFAGNDNKEDATGFDLGSKLTFVSNYTGWLYVLVGPVNIPDENVIPEDQFASVYAYNLTCTVSFVTSTPTATATSVPFTGGGGGGGTFSTPVPFRTSTPTMTPTPFEFPTQFPTATPIDLSFLTPQPTDPPPVVQFQPLPTATPVVGAGGTATNINVTLYYDTNFNYLPELTEGIADVAVFLYDNATGSLLSFGSTNETGEIGFNGIVSTGGVRVEVPLMGYSQIVIGSSSNILLRVAPEPLPIGIP